MIIRARSPFTIKQTEPSPPTVLPRFTCADTVISGLAIAANGTVTNPTVTVGTFHSIEPSTFTAVDVATVHNVVVKVTYDSNSFRIPSETSDSTEVHCVVQVTQPATVVAATCTNFELRNPHTTEVAYYQYVNCSNTAISGYLAANTNLTVCVYPNTTPFITNQGTQKLAYYFNLNTICT